ncbi:hypothetical protein DAA48_22475 [Aeromonas veronii]|uniref:Uncharacterized protein n=1 Tax=Aeromonas veronii TaxID=654 RepID=A0A2T4MX76_AERVE|nr:hypothetical protein DAA48_22475 [Aeromonas veronii]
MTGLLALLNFQEKISEPKWFVLPGRITARVIEKECFFFLLLRLFLVQTNKTLEFKHISQNGLMFYLRASILLSQFLLFLGLK